MYNNFSIINYTAGVDCFTRQFKFIKMCVNNVRCPKLNTLIDTIYSNIFYFYFL